MIHSAPQNRHIDMEDSLKRRHALETIPLAAAGLAGGIKTNAAGATQSAARPKLAEVRMHNGAPTFFLRGKPAFYSSLWVATPIPGKWGHQKGSWPWPISGDTDSAQRTAAATDTHIYTFFTGSEWSGPGKDHTGLFDFSKTEESFREILKTDPNALFHLRIQLEMSGRSNEYNGPPWWQSTYPDECEITSEGRQVEQSYASTVWREEAKEFLRAYIAHLDRIGIAEKVTAYHVCAGQSTEWTKWSSSGRRACGDYSPPMKRHFRDWLRRTYGDDVDRLRKTWNNVKVTFETAEVPSPEEQLGAKLYSFRDPKTERNVSDYYTCLAELCADLNIDFCRTAKEACGGISMAGTSYGYTLTCSYNQGFYGEGPVTVSSEFSHNQRGGHMGLARVLASPYIDFIGSPISYGFRGVGGDASISQASESCRIHGKLLIMEEDSRIHDMPPNSTFGRVNTPADSEAVLRRNLARAVIHAQAAWRAPMDFAPFLPLLKRFNEIGAFALGLDRTPSAEVAVITDEENFFHMSDRYDLDLAATSHQVLKGLARFGAPFDHYLLDDLAEGRVKPYKLYIFPYAWRIDAARREKIKKELRRDGRIAVWVYAPGFVADDASVDNMKDLTGFTYGRSDYPFPSFMHITDFTHPITERIPQDLFWSFSAPMGPLFWIEDPEARILGQVAISLGRNVPGMGVKRFPEWTSVHVAVPDIPAPVLRGLARFAGVHLYSDAGDVLYASRDLLAVHTVAGGKRTFRLPRRVEVVRDLFTGKPVAWNVSAFTVDLVPKSSELWYVGSADIAGKAPGKA